MVADKYAGRVAVQHNILLIRQAYVEKGPQDDDQQLDAVMAAVHLDDEVFKLTLQRLVGLAVFLQHQEAVQLAAYLLIQREAEGGKQGRRDQHQRGQHQRRLQIDLPGRSRAEEQQQPQTDQGDHLAEETGEVRARRVQGGRGFIRPRA